MPMNRRKHPPADRPASDRAGQESRPLPAAIMTNKGLRPVLEPLNNLIDAPPPPDLVQVIAKAIKKVDKTYFFENYTTQALSVMRALAENGYWVVPTNPTPKMLEAGRDSLRFGVQKSGDSLAGIYKSMIDAHKI
jgi:hypothetical protein